MKKLIAGISMAALALAVAGTAGAAVTITTTVDDDLSLTFSQLWDFNFWGDVDNTANVTNTVTSSADSGNNSIDCDEDCEDVSVTTGNADAASLTLVEGNDTNLDLSAAT